MGLEVSPRPRESFHSNFHSVIILKAEASLLSLSYGLLGCAEGFLYFYAVRLIDNIQQITECFIAVICFQGESGQVHALHKRLSTGPQACPDFF
jgi:hypothetical protein